jgi:hypothetical protein
LLSSQRLFDWLTSGDVPLDESGVLKVSQTSYDYTRPYWDQIVATVAGRHAPLTDLSGYAKKSAANGDTRSGLRSRLRIAAPGPTRQPTSSQRLHPQL